MLKYFVCSILKIVFSDSILWAVLCILYIYAVFCREYSHSLCAVLCRQYLWAAFCVQYFNAVFSAVFLGSTLCRHNCTSKEQRQKLSPESSVFSRGQLGALFGTGRNKRVKYYFFIVNCSSIFKVFCSIQPLFGTGSNKRVK